MTLAIATLGMAVGLLGVLVVGLLRSHAEVLRRLHELGAGVYDDQLPTAGRVPAAAGVGAGARAPARVGARDVAGISPSGDVASIAIAGRDRLTLLAFLSSGCSACARFWDAIGGEREDDLTGRSDVRLVVVTRGPEAESPAAIARLAPAGVTTVMSTAAFDDYRVPAVPYTVLVDGRSGRVVGEGTAVSWQQVLGLVRRATAESERDDGRRGSREDADLLAAGIRRGDPSLYRSRRHAGHDAAGGGG